MTDGPAVENALNRTVEYLLSKRNAQRHWDGYLSDSALATAIAVFALKSADAEKHKPLIDNGLRWIIGDINADGGWGDSPESPSNISATLLCWSALPLAGEDPAAAEALRRAETYITREAGSLEPAAVRDAVFRRYGNDRTFAAPILTMCALAGRLGPEPEAWSFVPQLPFELVAFPHGFFKSLRLSVVSYALPALVAIGLVRHRKLPSSSPLKIGIRNAVTRHALRVAQRMQPPNGGYEEATPLTGFVAMSLVAAGYRDHEIVRRATAFFEESVRPNGSWPICTTLATWVTALAINVLSERASHLGKLTQLEREALGNWLLGQQHDEQHPLTFGAPGGWAWSDRLGAMPDADDTSGVLVALRKLGRSDDASRAAVMRGLQWLLDLQNSDGGIPTFSRGWGRLPFDRSCPDITAHALRAFDLWYDVAEPRLRSRIDHAMEWAVNYLTAVQEADGSWCPLWFGNQHAPGEVNRTYGTAQVVIALQDMTAGRFPERDALAEKGRRWLRNAQNDDGGWGGGRGVASSLEETGLAVRALAAGGCEEVVRGVEWLLKSTDGGRLFAAAPIGLYFAKLSYSEALYPVLFTAWALTAIRGDGARPRIEPANRWIVTFRSMHTVLAAEKVFEEHDVEYELVPAPRAISSDCSTGIAVRREDGDPVRTVLGDRRVDIQGVYEQGGDNAFTEISV